MTDDDDDLSQAIRRHASRYTASPALRASVRTQIALADAGRRARPASPLGWLRSLSWRTAAVGFALGVLSVLCVGPLLRLVDSPAAIESELVADHVRALGAGPLVAVESSDRHTVKPWFQGRIDYAPPVRDLADAGFPLLGGRLEHVHDQTVAVLVYKRKLHVINLFVWPSDGARSVQHDVRRGFNIVHWADGSMQYWLVSDVEGAELEALARTWQARAAAH